MAVTAQMVKELRATTGAGMMDCKNVLVETNGDMERAVEVLREKGLAKAAKKADRIAAEGIVRTAFSDDKKSAAIIEVNSETDFVAKNNDFVEFVEKLAKKALEARVADVEVFLGLPYENEGSVQDALNNKIATIGENLNIRRFQVFQNPDMVYTGYIHGNDKVAVIVGVKTDAAKDVVEPVGKDVAMQIAAMSPKFLHEGLVAQAFIQEESKIFTQLVINEGKKPEMVDNIVKGKIKKLLKEVCLLEQKFVKDSEKTVKQYVEDAAKVAGTTMQIEEMLRYEVGEGIEKKEENFAEEVAKQMGK